MKWNEIEDIQFISWISLIDLSWNGINELPNAGNNESRMNIEWNGNENEIWIGLN